VLGLAFLFVGVVYLFISVWLVKLAMRQAKKRGIAKWKWGVPAGFVMYLLVFWDHIPTLAAHQYYCKTEAGFTVYKTLDEWKQENPGVAETLTYEENAKGEGDRSKYIRHLNQRFDSVTTRTLVFLSVKQRKYQVVDNSNGDVFAEYVDYGSGGGFQNANTLTDYKLWLANSACDKGMKDRTRFNKYRRIAERIGE
jgi:hypothetical protein